MSVEHDVETIMARGYFQVRETRSFYPVERGNECTVNPPLKIAGNKPASYKFAEFPNRDSANNNSPSRDPNLLATVSYSANSLRGFISKVIFAFNLNNSIQKKTRRTFGLNN